MVAFERSDQSPTSCDASRPYFPLNVLGALLVALSVSLFLTILAHAFVCLGLHPEAIYFANTAIPLQGILSGATFLGGRKNSRARDGLVMALVAVFFWFLIWGYLVARFDLSLWPVEVFGGLNYLHFGAWGAALVVGAVGGVIGKRMGKQRKTNLHWFAYAVLVTLILPICMLYAVAGLPENTPSQIVTLSSGVTLRTDEAAADGTVLRLLTFDFAKEPGLDFGIYDADSDDAVPSDDRNTSWLGRSLELVVPRVQERLSAENRELRCLINAGFFGARDSWVAFHEAAIVVDGKPLYSSQVLKNDWPDQSWVFGISRRGGRPQFHLEDDVPWEQLGRRFQTAFCGVRPLRVAGTSRVLKPGMGNTTLRCSRTSIGWSKDSSKFYILIVRDPDGETASLNQKKTGRPLGGWDVHQVQQFWEKLQVPNAVLFDGGESTELTYRDAAGGYPMVHCAYHVSRTLAYWNQRPLRVFLPLLPAAPNQGGVLNYFYVHGPAGKK